MASDQKRLVKDAVYKLQLSLLEGIQNENQLFAAGSIMSRSDYEDLVIERSIANLCGYPLCQNPLPTNRTRKGKYRISLKEHKLYDLEEEYKYCSPTCVAKSYVFSGSLQPERCLVMNKEKLDEVVKLFGSLSLGSEEVLGKNGDLGMSGLRIQEKSGTIIGDVSAEQWMGPSNAVEGYVPQRYSNFKPPTPKNHKKGSQSDVTKLMNEMDFMSTIITSDEYSVSKTSPNVNEMVSSNQLKSEKVVCEESEGKSATLEALSAPRKDGSGKRASRSKREKSTVSKKDNISTPEVPSILHQCKTDCMISTVDPEEKCHDGKAVGSQETLLKPSLKRPGTKKTSRSVTWAEENPDGSSAGGNLSVLSERNKSKRCSELPSTSMDLGIDEDIIRFASAEACADALSQAAEAVASGEADISDVLSEAGIVILPPPSDVNEEARTEDVESSESEMLAVKWPNKPGIPKSEVFDPEDSWYDAPPEGFSLALSPFATMWMALFAWITSSTLAYIYGRDDSFHEEYQSVNGREYPRKIVSSDGLSSEIKQTLAGCLERALPGIVAELRLPTPVSTLEQGMGHLLDTMTFLDPLPPFRVKQWQVISLLFIEALSVCRIPPLTSSMTNRSTLLYKVLDGVQLRVDEYEVMKDLFIPLGRAPNFSAQKGA